MAVGILTGGMPSELGDALIAIDVIALTAFFGMLYAREIAAATRRFMALASPSLLLSRFRLWRSAHKSPH